MCDFSKVYFQWLENITHVMKTTINREKWKLCPTLCDHIDCSPPGPSVHGILHASILEWVTIAFSMRYFWPRSPALQADSLLSEPPGKPISRESVNKSHKSEGGLLTPKPDPQSLPNIQWFGLNQRANPMEPSVGVVSF